MLFGVFAWASFMCGLQPAFYQLVVDVDALFLPGLWFVVLFLGFKVFFFYFSLVAAESLFSLSSSASRVVSWFTPKVKNSWSYTSIPRYTFVA